MAKVKNFEKVLKVLTEASPNAVTKEEIARQLGDEIETYRLSTYIWEIKNTAGVPVTSIKDGRKVVSFSIPAAVAPTASADQGIAEAFVAKSAADENMEDIAV